MTLRHHIMAFGRYLCWTGFSGNEKISTRLLTTNKNSSILTIGSENNYQLEITNERRDGMMPLTMAKAGEVNTIKKVGGKEKTRRFLENLGFVTGGNVEVVSDIGGNLIVNVKDSRVAIGKDMANKIFV